VHQSAALVLPMPQMTTTSDNHVLVTGRVPGGEPTAVPSPLPSVRLNLALQGGGAHGAYTWGVLEQLLDDDSIEIGDVSGTSAGALNGAALVTGLLKGGRQGAKDNLALLWRQVTEAGSLMSMMHVPLKKPGLGVWDDAMPMLSPYQTNTFALEPLKYILTSTVDVELLRRAEPPGPTMSVNAVNVQTGYSRVFGSAEMSLSAIMASACAPFMFQAVEIEGVSYWDGSYAGNPMLWPLYEGMTDVDIMMVELTPLHRPETPTTAKNILNRINEIASINGLVSELRLMASYCERSGQVARMHIISLPDSVPPAETEPSTKRTIGPLLFETLRRQGRSACAEWLRQHRAKLGVCPTSDIESRYLRPYSPRASSAKVSAQLTE
jgi:NTE family protein